MKNPPLGGRSLDDIGWTLLGGLDLHANGDNGYRRREIARWRRAAASAAFWQEAAAETAEPMYVARSCATVTHPFETSRANRWFAIVA